MCVVSPVRIPTPAQAPSTRRSEGIALAIVLVMIVLLVTAVYTFSRRAVINVSVARNRIAAAEADALARGGLRLAEAVVFLARAREEVQESDSGPSIGGEDLLAALLGSSSTDFWAQLEDFPIELAEGQSLRLSIEETGAKLNLNALVPQDPDDQGEDGDTGDDSSSTTLDEEESLEYLVLVLQHVIDGIEASPEDKNYDARAIAENLIDYMDADDTAITGRSENSYYMRQDPPYATRNGPFLSFEEIGMVEGVDPGLLRALRDYVTVYPIGGTAGIDLNRAEPWVLSLIYSGPSGDRELLGEREVRELWGHRKSGKLICTSSDADPQRCITLAEAGLGEGSLYPETPLPAPVAVFRVVAEARVGNLTRRMEAIYDTRPLDAPQLLSWRRLRGAE